ncbi:MAG: NAD-glutamate dehydrogenase domain-containing protein, partial [Candidatus Methylumidiphilus sp.]
MALNIVLVNPAAGSGRERAEARAEALAAWIGQEADGRRRGLLRALAELLLPAESALTALPPDSACALLAAALDFILVRQDEVALLAWRPAGGGPTWLLAYGADAPWAAESLECLPAARAGLLRRFAHVAFGTRRDAAGGLLGLEPGVSGEALIVLRQDGGQDASAAVRATLSAALAAARDAALMQARLAHLAGLPWPPTGRAVLDWLTTGAFLPFAYQGRATSGDEDWGIALPDGLPPILANGDLAVRPIRIISPLCRDEPLLCVACREDLPDGTQRRHAFFGLLAADALAAPASALPVLRRAIRHAVDSVAVAGSVAFQRVAELFDAFPKVELLFTGEEQLYLIARSLLRFQARSGRIKLLLLASPAPDVLALLALMPKSAFQERQVPTLERWLLAQLPAERVGLQILQGAADHVGLCWTLAPLAEDVRLDLGSLERGLNRLSHWWDERFGRFLRRCAGLERGMALVAAYAGALPPGYRELTPPTLAGRDVCHIERLLADGRDGLELWRRPGDSRHWLRIYSLRERFLDEVLPLLGALGLRVAEPMQFALACPGGLGILPADMDKSGQDARAPRMVSIASFAVQAARPDALPLRRLKKPLLDALGRLLRGDLESDGLNELLLLTGLDGRDIEVFRGYRNYHRQLRRHASRESFQQALLRNPQVALLQHRYFAARFDPRLTCDAACREEAFAALRVDIAAALDAVADSAEDRILRDLFNLIDATVRSNHYIRRDADEYFLACKISSLGVFDMPTPAPLFEIFVHAAHMEGIHLRAAKVARGGIRWSDRPDDYRTEILGLLQTQMIKNALIVPHGAKGGFIVKRPAGGKATRGEADAAYATFIRGLLDVTDNLSAEGPQRPPGLLAYDGADPYLVVAADKGTAHLSDTANALAQEYGFLLGDAFASGGSLGYDHKKLGITARGAWECVKRHGRELGRDFSREPFTVVGVGSMDGDVFGNGMLQTDAIRLRAAFGATHIFLDPEPDGPMAYAERQRLFALPGSTWDDYDRRLLSEGGGVYPRSAKDIPLAPVVRHWLGARQASIDGEGLIRLLLTAPVDLLWLGGIGSYVKASGQTHEQVGDRANDAVRVDAAQLRASIVGEGANLGCTALARVEFAQAGGKINNDAVDNAGGVNLSDHEVNLKILLAGQADRDATLHELTGTVCAQVLADNWAQSLCISLDEARVRRDAALFLDVAERLENASLLDRATEAFPSRAAVVARTGPSLTRPELAVLMLHSKLALKQALLQDRRFLAEAELRPSLAGYFPEPLRTSTAFARHSLAAEITATRLANALINQAGCGFLALAESWDAAAFVAAARAYLHFDRLFGGTDLRDSLRTLQEQLPAAREYALRLRLEDLLADCCRWQLRHGPALNPAALADEADLQAYVEFVAQQLDAEAQAGFAAECAELADCGLPQALAQKLALLDRLSEFPGLAELAAAAGQPLLAAARCQRDAAEYLGLADIDAQLQRLTVRDAWERRVQSQLRVQFRRQLARLTRALLAAAPATPEAFIARRGAMAQWQNLRQLRRELDNTAPGHAICLTAERTRDEAILPAAERLAAFLVQRPTLHGCFVAFVAAPLREPYGDTTLSAAERDLLRDPGPGVFVDCLHFDAPFLVHLGRLLGKPALVDCGAAQAVAMIDLLQDPATGVFAHFALA